MAEVSVALIAVGLLVGLAALVALHMLPTGLSPVRNAVSQYGISDYRAGYRVQTIAYGVAGAGAALGIAVVPGPVVPAICLCAVFAAARLAISWFPMDEPGADRTPTGRRHGLLAIAAFATVTAAAGRLPRVLGHDHLHPGLALASGVLAVAMLVSFVLMAAGRRGGFFGLAERGFYACMTAWLVLVAVLLAAQM